MVDQMAGPDIARPDNFDGRKEYCCIVGHVFIRTIAICYTLAYYRFLNIIHYPNSLYFTYLHTLRHAGAIAFSFTEHFFVKIWRMLTLSISI